LLTDEGHAVRRCALQQNIPARTDPRRHCRLHAVFPRRSSFLDHERGCGAPPAALVARAGHSDFKTTQGYIGLAGETFREEADRLDTPLGRFQYQEPVPRSRFVACRGNGGMKASAFKTAASSGFVLNGAAQESNLPSVGLRRRTGFEDQVGHRPRPLRR
jgi:hypothetical protein